MSNELPFSGDPRPRVAQAKNADAVIQALGALARAQERGMALAILERLQRQVIDAAGADGDLLDPAA